MIIGSLLNVATGPAAIAIEIDRALGVDLGVARRILRRRPALIAIAIARPRPRPTPTAPPSR